MPTSSHVLKIDWSYWTRTPTVSWSCDETLVSFTLKLSPISVAHLPNLERIAVIGCFDEFGSANLLLYSYDGKLQRTITAPELGPKAQFGGLSEKNGELLAILGFEADKGWTEQAGRLNLDDGTVTDLHRHC